MIRLEKADLEDTTMLKKLASAAHCSTEEFKTAFAHVACD
jgi:hypothetical protein